LQLACDQCHAPRDPLLIQLDAGNRIELCRMPVLGEEIERGAPGDPSDSSLYTRKCSAITAA